MAAATDIRNTPPREDAEILRALMDLEGPINEVMRLVRITTNLSDGTLAMSRAKKQEDRYVFTLSKDELEDLCFLGGEAQIRASLLRDAFYGAVHGEAA